MKKLSCLLLAVALVSNAFSQSTNAPVQPNTLTSDFSKLLSDGWNTLKGDDFGGGVEVAPFAIYHEKNFGGGLAITTVNTNTFIHLGFAAAVIHDSKSKSFEFYDATISVQLGEQITLPIVHWKPYMFVEVGPAINLANPNTILEQSIAGGEFSQNLGNGWTLKEWAGVGHNSEWPDSPFYIAGLAVSKAF